MKILPSSEKDRCGLLNTLFNDKDKKYLYNIPENANSGDYSGRVQNVINCKNYANWPSSSSKPYFEITLSQLAIKPYKITLTRRNNYQYPASAVLEGFYHSKWEQICPTSITFTTANEVAIRTCKSNKYYTAFRYNQTKNSASIRYIEFHSFDIFGEMYYFDQIKNCSNNVCRRRYISFVFVIIALIIS